ncbi:hypothetical protein N7510_004103 [Penicillium lagena]|uniref:uncharacterized protein n=1 Tax=Penicillium lagena TaxID=94218 RepID=UPI0025402485|nr:uncharacterized protein N7510_004103 [Penicillium lagena]KAJ5620119.1 hypothetical protein N7510_004103 [Penicillium lagena]
MSLNGLDNPAVFDAYQGALADAGGWFLLHYVSRDEVALLDRGTGGVSEIRNAIANYSQVSPLYGFLQYRRRKVVIRYMPEGLSRLIQARSNVQFGSFLEKFTPNDTVLPLAQAAELTESALSSACLLHTASTSITSSSSSLRRRRLMEITEDAEENGAKDEAQHPKPELQTRQRSGSQRSEATVVPPSTAPSPSTETTSPDLRPPPSRDSAKTAPPLQASPRELQSSALSPMSPPMSPSTFSERQKPRSILDEFPRPSDDIRMSTQSSRPSLRDLERTGSYTQKVKLGPRPSVDSSGRPRTSGSSRNAEQRPVASLPAGIRSSSLRKPPAMDIDTPRPRSQGSQFASKPSKFKMPPVPPLLVPPPSIPISRPPLSPGAKSLGALSTSSGLTPEKERLMKALQQRKKAQAKRAEQANRKQSIAEEEPTARKGSSENKENKAPLSEKAVEKKPEPTKVESVKVAPEKVESQPVPEKVELVMLRPMKFEPEKLEPDQSKPEKFEPQPELENIQPENKEPKELEPENLETETLEPVRFEPKRVEPEQPQTERSEPQPAQREGFEGPLQPLPPTSEPVFDLHPAIEPEKEDVPAPVEVAKPVPTAELMMSDSEGAATAASTEPVDTASETGQLETPQTLADDETSAEHGHSAILGLSDTKDDAVPPSANAQVPLEKGSPAASEAEDISSHQPRISSATDEPVENSPAEASESVAVPASPSTISPIDPPVVVSIDPRSLDEPALGVASEDTHLSNPKRVSLDQRRKINLEPIHVPPAEYSDDDNLLSDDSFMEELKSATVQEARPVAVSSPNISSRSVSSPNTPGSPANMQALAAGRSASSNYPDNEPPTPVLMAKKINVSSGISNRIKALEKLSSREGTPSNSGQTVTGPSASSSFESLRKRASVSLPSGTQLPDFSRAPSLNHHTHPAAGHDTRRTNSISVTARIVRDSAMSPELLESDVLNLHASPLTVEHETAEGPLSESITIQSEDRRPSISSAGSRATSRPGSRLSFASRNKTDETLQSTSPTSEEKKGSRASRLMRRMSSITSTSRRSIIGAWGPPVKEEDTTFATMDNHSVAHKPAFSPIDIGEVNVQFPDTLLWKRRFMRVDENGFLVLAPGTTDSTARNMVKRYHLSAFRTPCLPDEDCQELPNSILLDFLDGSTLQFACESRQGQASTLQTLVDAYNAHQK